MPHIAKYGHMHIMWPVHERTEANAPKARAEHAINHYRRHAMVGHVTMSASNCPVIYPRKPEHTEALCP